MTFFASALVFITVVGFCAAAVLAFCWAGSSGQFYQIEKGALSVFDQDELPKTTPPVNASADTEASTSV